MYKWVGLNVFRHDLEAAETMHFGSMHLVWEALNKVFVDDSIGCGKEGEGVWDEVALVVVYLVVQSWRSLDASISSAVQNEAETLYISTLMSVTAAGTRRGHTINLVVDQERYKALFWLFKDALHLDAFIRTWQETK